MGVKRFVWDEVSDNVLLETDETDMPSIDVRQSPVITAATVGGRFFPVAVLKRLLAGETDYEPLLPWNWAAAHPDSIRTYRKDERNDREIRKKRRTKLNRR